MLVRKVVRRGLSSAVVNENSPDIDRCKIALRAVFRERGDHSFPRQGGKRQQACPESSIVVSMAQCA